MMILIRGHEAKAIIAGPYYSVHQQQLLDNCLKGVIILIVGCLTFLKSICPTCIITQTMYVIRSAAFLVVLINFSVTSSRAFVTEY